MELGRINQEVTKIQKPSIFVCAVTLETKTSIWRRKTEHLCVQSHWREKKVKLFSMGSFSIIIATITGYRRAVQEDIGTLKSEIAIHIQIQWSQTLKPEKVVTSQRNKFRLIRIKGSYPPKKTIFVKPVRWNITTRWFREEIQYPLNIGPPSVRFLHNSWTFVPCIHKFKKLNWSRIVAIRIYKDCGHSKSKEA